MFIIHKVKCKYCGETFNRDKVPFKQVSSTRYAHLECAEKAEQERLELEKIKQEKLEQERLEKENKKTKEEKDKEALEAYIKKIFNEKRINAKIKRQIEAYKKDYNFTYSGIHKALIYFYEIQGNDMSKANGGIGIVPYCYKQAYDYYYFLWQTKQINQNKDMTNYVPKERIVVIEAPKRKVRKRFFSFLDNDEV